MSHINYLDRTHVILTKEIYSYGNVIADPNTMYVVKTLHMNDSGILRIKHGHAKLSCYLIYFWNCKIPYVTSDIRILEKICKPLYQTHVKL